MRAAVEFEKKAAKEAEEKRVASALNFKSATTYPSLGSGSVGAAAPPKATMNFAGVAAVAAATTVAATTTIATATAAAVAAPFSRHLDTLLHRRTIVTHCYEDIPEDYDGPDEGQMSKQESVPEGEGCDDWTDTSDTNDGQFNASLMESHRRSIW
jgi:hypothetical protein